MLTPRSHQRWILLVAAVLVASIIVTAALAAVLTHLLFPNGFLIDPPRAEPVTEEPLPTRQSDETSLSFGWRASVACSVWLGDLEEAKRPG